MRGYQFACAVIVAAMMPAAALADESSDAATRIAAVRARDREAIRQLNLHELATVRERDARYAQGQPVKSDEGSNWRAYAHDLDSYARNRAQYERQMAAWRRAVEACRAGDYSACRN